MVKRKKFSLFLIKILAFLTMFQLIFLQIYIIDIQKYICPERSNKNTSNAHKNINVSSILIKLQPGICSKCNCCQISRQGQTYLTESSNI